MELLNPGLGLIVWMSVAFLIVFFLGKKFAWSGILKSLKEREDFIDRSLQSAEKAKAEMSELKAENEKLLQEARLERELILKEAKETKEKIVSEAKQQAKKESEKIISNARVEITKEKAAAISDIRNQVATLSLEIAEKVLKREVSDKDHQLKLVEESLENKASMN